MLDYYNYMNQWDNSSSNGILSTNTLAIEDNQLIITNVSQGFPPVILFAVDDNNLINLACCVAPTIINMPVKNTNVGQSTHVVPFLVVP